MKESFLIVLFYFFLNPLFSVPLLLNKSNVNNEINKILPYPKTGNSSASSYLVVPSAAKQEHYFSSIFAVKKAETWNRLIPVFIQSLIVGLLAVFTPYVFALVPVTVSYITTLSRKRNDRIRHSLFYALSLIFLFTTFGILVSILVGTTGLSKLTNHWIFNLFFCRIFLGLGISFLGVFELKLPASWSNFTTSKSAAGSLKSIFYLALTLPIVTIASTGPIMGLVLVLSGNGGLFGPIVGMLGFSFGLSLPFVFPLIINLISSISWLNHIKVLFGFFSILLGLKFLSKTCIALNWDILDRNMFIIIWSLLMVTLGIYMLGKMKFSNDYITKKNNHQQEYVSVLRLIIAIASFAFAIYLIPGLWGAPLYAVNDFLPPK